MDMKQAVKTYNNIMFSICEEYNTIGTSFTEDAETRNRWTIRDLVSEVQYCLDKWNDPDCIYWQDAHDDCQPAGNPWLKNWNKERAMFRRFINKYKAEALKTKCVSGHCSKYD